MVNKEKIDKAQKAIRDTVASVPGVQIRSASIGSLSQKYPVDLVARLKHANTERLLIVAALSDGAPRFVRAATFLLTGAATAWQQTKGSGNSPVALVCAPYLSLASQEICREHDVAYIDLAGNARLSFGSVYIERESTRIPTREKRALRSLFAGRKATAVLFALLRDVEQVWRIKGLATASGVSAGHISNVRKALLAREWIEVTPKGMRLSDPGALLKAWREKHQRPGGEYIGGFMHLHGAPLNERLKGVLNTDPERPRAILGMTSAANYYEPWVRDSVLHCYADRAGAEALQAALKVERVGRGINIGISVTNNDTLFEDAEEPAEGVFCTSRVATYLDMWCGNDRYREGAERLTERHLPWFTD